MDEVLAWYVDLRNQLKNVPIAQRKSLLRKINACEAGWLRLKSRIATAEPAARLYSGPPCIKYRPDQPRIPAGNPDGGQWTYDGGSGGGASAQRDRPVFVRVEPLDTGTESDEPPIQNVAWRTVVDIDYSRALTGISTIDETTKALSETLASTMVKLEFVATWTPRAYGTAVHVAFGTAVRLQGLPGIGWSDVEHSFNDGRSADYGGPGSVRTDVVLRNAAGEVIAIYDVKTGGATLSAARVRTLRTKTKVGPNVPIIELHVLRGQRSRRG